MSTEPEQKQGSKLTTAEVAARAGVGLMTVYNWRQGSVRRDPLPCETEPAGTRHRVVFDEAVTKDWMARHGISFKKTRAGKPGTGARSGS